MNTFLKTLSFIPMLVLLMGASNCTHNVKYESDKGFLAPYQAEALEFPVMINSFVCKDMTNKVGACTKIISEREDITFSILPMPYQYNLRIKCSSQVNFSHDSDVLANTKYIVVLNKDAYQDIPEFICAGRITPSDRNFVSARFEIRVRVFDGQFVERGDGYVFENKGKHYLNMGKNALYTTVFDRGEWTTYKKSPVIRVYDLDNLKAFSESEIMRINFYNF